MMDSMTQSQLFEDNPYLHSEENIQEELDDLRARRPSFVTFGYSSRNSCLEKPLYRNPIGLRDLPDYRRTPPLPELSMYDKFKDYLWSIKEFLDEIVEYTLKRNL